LTLGAGGVISGPRVPNDTLKVLHLLAIVYNLVGE